MTGKVRDSAGGCPALLRARRPRPVVVFVLGTRREQIEPVPHFILDVLFAFECECHGSSFLYHLAHSILLNYFSICFDRHVFHKGCVDQWLLEQRSCPMCKLDILKHYGLTVSYRALIARFR